MVRLIELSKDGLLIEWRKHLLSGVMEARHEEFLALEPALHDENHFASRRLKDVSSNEDGVSWRWGDWNKVKITPYCDGAEMGSIIRRPPAKGFIKWKEIPFCDHIEITPVDKNGADGVTIRIDRPLLVTAQFADFGKQEVGWKKVRVDLLNPSLHKRVSIQKLQRDGRGFRSTGAPDSFNLQGKALVSVENFVGVIAVLLHVEQGARRLVDQAVYTGTGIMSLTSEEEIIAIREIVEHRTYDLSVSPSEGEEWMSQWPQKSQQRLGYIFDQASRLIGATVASRLIRSNSAGLARLLVLRRCRFPFPQGMDRAIESLQQSSFLQAIRDMAPLLPSDFEHLMSLEQEWVIGRATDGRIAEAVEWARGGGVASLDLALDLVATRREARDLKANLRPDCAESRELEKLVDDIQKAPSTKGNPSRLRDRLAEIKRRVQENDRRPVNPEEPPPIRLDRHAQWKDATRRMIEWRQGLLRVISYCESGVYETSPASSSPDEMEERLKRIKVPSREPRRRQEASSDVKDRISMLTASKLDEPRQRLRSLAVEWLEKIIGPNIDDFSALHAEIREARRISATEAQYFSWIIKQIGFEESKSLSEQAGIAHIFLDMAEALETRLKAWRKTRLTAKSNDFSELKAILTDPTHPRIDESYRRCREIYEILSLPRYRSGIKMPDRLPSLKKVSLVSIKTYWDALSKLDETLDQLESRVNQFQSHAGDIAIHLIPAVGEFVNYWKEQPKEKQPRIYKKMADHYQRCCESGSDINPEALSALIHFLVEHPRWREDAPLENQSFSKAAES
jgi:hypothetical protein